MSAGTGVTHSEYNASRNDPVHFLQIWILPETTGLAPGYEQRTYPAAERRGKLRLVASRDGAEGSIRLAQDVRLYASLLDPGEEVTLEIEPGRHAWVQVARGAIALGGLALGAGDGAAVTGSGPLAMRADAEHRSSSAEILVFNLP
jgi:redox-sensitive bicupin YhaK (pirin superfamily)